MTASDGPGLGDQFEDLEREYTEARQEINPLEASNERFALRNHVATLQAEVSRQSDELDERDRLLGELSNKVTSFQSDLAERDATLAELHEARQQLAAERREQSRLTALLDARAAEREELATATQRLQNERDNVQELLTQALERFEVADQLRITAQERALQLEADGEVAAGEHNLRAHELIESRAEMSKLTEQLDEARRTASNEKQRADKAEALAERRANESGYLNRRIQAMTVKLDEATAVQNQATNLRQELVQSERQVADLERELAALRAETDAAHAAVAAVAERTANYDELVAKIDALETERDASLIESSGSFTGRSEVLDAEPAPVAAADEVVSLADRARELSERRSIDQELIAAAYEIAGDEMPPPAAPVEAPPVEELAELTDEDLPVIDHDLAEIAPAPHVLEGDTVFEEDTAFEADTVFEEDTPTAEIPQVTIPRVPDLPPPPPPPAPVSIPEPEPGPAMTGVGATRKRMVLPADMEPNTPMAVSYLLNQPGVSAIVDARSTCGRTGIRPSELFDRLAAIRDHYDVPIEVVVTPVSTPVGGAPSLPAIGVHHITGADTVADRVRALCMGFPTDQPLVVIAGDDHVRRAAIAQEANVVEPAAVVSLAAD